MYECLNTPRNPLKLCTTHAESSALEAVARRGRASGRSLGGVSVKGAEEEAAAAAAMMLYNFT